jgi:uncharacterized protein YndB with AHSA1/START domain
VFFIVGYNEIMKEMQFSVAIDAGRERVWDILWRDETFREWAGIIDPGTHMVGELKEGNEVQYISGNGYGVTSLVERLIPNELLQLRHSADTKENGKQEREKEWSGGTESYRLVEKDEITTLTAVFDVPPEMEEYFQTNYPKALGRIKLLAEKKEQ